DEIGQGLEVRRVLFRSLRRDRAGAAAEIEIAGAGSRLDEGLALPLLALGPGFRIRRAVGADAVVTRERVEAHDEQALAARRPEAGVELGAGPVAVRRADERADALGGPHVALGQPVVFLRVGEADEEDVEVPAGARLAPAGG